MSLKGGRADNALNRSWFGPISARQSVFAFAVKSQLVGLYAGAEHHVSHIEVFEAVYFLQRLINVLEQEQTKLWHFGPVDLFREMGL
ncbi:MAG: hypothetical protein SOV62_04340 [Alloprevotella sp.]|nr:hypothetical protein [Alloprevotella sp.]